MRSQSATTSSELRWELRGKLTGKPDALSSARSLTLPPTTQALTPLTFILAAMIPPIAAQVCPGGCSMTNTVPSSAISTQCWPFGTVPGSDSGNGGTSEDFPTSFRVETGAMILGGSSTETCHGGLGGNGTAHYMSEHDCERKSPAFRTKPKHTYVGKVASSCNLTWRWLLKL